MLEDFVILDSRYIVITDASLFGGTPALIVYSIEDYKVTPQHDVHLKMK